VLAAVRLAKAGWRFLPALRSLRAEYGYGGEKIKN
jgi:hypothetical protein